jgi:hypothetical protein
MSIQILNRYIKRFKHLDFFGVGFSFQVKNHTQYRSLMGGIIFVVFFIVSLYYALISAHDFLDRKTMNLIFTQKYIFPNPLINFNREEFNLAFQLVYDANNTLINSETQKYIYEKINLVTIRNSDVTNKTKIPLTLRDCRNEDFYNKQNDSYSNLKKSSISRCINESNLNTEGAFEYPIYTYLDYGVYIKKEFITNKQNVTNLAFLKDYFTKNRVKIVIYYIDSSLDVDKFTDPISQFFGSLMFYVDMSMVRKVNVDFATNVFGDDQNILIGNNNDSTSIKYETNSPYFYTINDRTLVDDDSDLIAKFYIRSSSKVTLIKRKYQKLSDYMANIGSLISNLFLFLWIIMTYINKFSARQEIMNKTLKFKDYFKNKNQENVYEVLKKFVEGNENCKQKIIDKFPSPLKANNMKIHLVDELRDSNSINFLNLKNFETKNILILNKSDKALNTLNMAYQTQPAQLTDNKTLDRLPNDFVYNKRIGKSLVHGYKDVLGSGKKKPLNFNAFHFINQIFCFKNRRSQIQKNILKMAENKLDYYVDIYTYINKMQEIELLKDILLTPDQQKVFNFISIPSIFLTASDKQGEKNLLKDKREKGYNFVKNDIEDMINCYSALKNTSDTANTRLLRLFEMEIYDLIS